MKPLASIAFSFVFFAAAAIPEQVMALPSRVYCESSNNRVNRCEIDTSSRVRLTRQLSDATCNGNWSTGRGFVEVRNGCRGEFASDNGGGNNNNSGNSDSNRNQVTCESNDGRTNRCGINTNGNVSLIRQLSDKTCNGNWRLGNGYVEVRNGCRGQFANRGGGGNNWDNGGNWNNGGRDRITCESNDGRTNRCSMNTNGDVRLTRQLSSQTCYGNWSTGRGYVEVRNGCRGEFESRGNSSGGGWNGGDWNGGGWSGGNWSGSNYPNRTVCESRNGSPNRCPIDTRNQVRLRTRLSPRSCNNNWFVGNNFVEVRNGCSGEFVSD